MSQTFSSQFMTTLTPHSGIIIVQIETSDPYFLAISSWSKNTFVILYIMHFMKLNSRYELSTPVLYTLFIIPFVLDFLPNWGLA